MRDKIYYIADTYGCYYGFNHENKLIQVSDKSKASKLTFLKVNNVLQDMIKPSNRYQFILVDASNEESNTEVLFSFGEDLRKVLNKYKIFLSQHTYFLKLDVYIVKNKKGEVYL